MQVATTEPIEGRMHGPELPCGYTSYAWRVEQGQAPEHPDAQPAPEYPRTRVDWPGGWAEIETHPTYQATKQRATAARELGKVNGKRSASAQKPSPPTPGTRYQDPAKVREIADVVRDLPASDMPEQHEETHGQAIFAGWRITKTDGCYAVAELGAPYGTFADKAPLFDETRITWVGWLPPAAWQGYAPVRPLRNTRSHAVRWLMGPRGFAWHVRDPWQGESRGMYLHRRDERDLQTTDQYHEITLCDKYLWPCRGLDTPRVGVYVTKQNMPVFILELGGESPTRIVIMGMDDGKARP